MMVNRKNQQLGKSSENKTESKAGYGRRQFQKVKLLIRNSRPSVKGQWKDLSRRIGKLSGKRKNFSGSHPVISEASLSFSKILRSAWKDLPLFRCCITTWLMYWNVPALDVRNVGKFRLRSRDYSVRFRWMDCAPEAYASKRLMPCWG